MFRIKICGVTTAADAELAVAAGADAIGLNFFAGSPRYLPPDRAVVVGRAIPRGQASRVGVFVNAATGDVCAAFDALSLDLIQLAGDETPEYLATLGGRPVMKAMRVRATPGALAHVLRFIEPRRTIELPSGDVASRRSRAGPVRWHRQIAGLACLGGTAGRRAPAVACEPPADRSGRRPDARERRSGDCQRRADSRRRC